MEAKIRFGYPWTPLSLPNLVAWYDASDSDTITISTGVSQWDDKSGNGRHLAQPTGGNQPPVSSGAVNGLDAIDFEGSTPHWLRWTGTALTGTAYTVGAVTKHESLSHSQGICLLYSTGITNDYQSPESNIAHHYSHSAGLTFYQDGRTATPSSGISTGTVYNAVHKMGSSSQALYLNGAANGTASNTMTSLSAENILVGTRFYGGIVAPGNESMDGLICEIFITSDAISDADRAEWDAYVARWGL